MMGNSTTYRFEKKGLLSKEELDNNIKTIIEKMNRVYLSNEMKNVIKISYSTKESEDYYDVTITMIVNMPYEISLN